MALVAEGPLRTAPRCHGLSDIARPFGCFIYGLLARDKTSVRSEDVHVLLNQEPRQG